MQRCVGLHFRHFGLTSETGKQLEKILSKLSTKIGNEWKRLGTELKLEYSEMEQIEGNFSRMDHMIFDMLIKWSNRSEAPTEVEQLKVLETALIEVGRRDLAEELQDSISSRFSDVIVARMILTKNECTSVNNCMNNIYT